MSALRFLAALAAALATSLAPLHAAESLTARQRGEDFDALWQAIERGYAYLPRDLKALRGARAADRARAVAANDRGAFIAALEHSLERLRDEHASLSERSPGASRSVPSETDVWPVWRGGHAVVESVRTYGDADVAGLKPGDRIARIEGVPVEDVVRRRLARGEQDAAAREWALRHALAGPRTGTLHLELGEGGAARKVAVERGAATAPNGPPIMARRIGEARDLGYLRLRGDVGDTSVAAQFAPALQSLRDTRALIVDLRDAHGDGGRANVEAILSRFAASPTPWRIREDARGRRISDTVAPGNGTYRAPVVVLVDRWTAGDGEALAAGLAAVAKARLVGTPMAGLRGELREATLPHSGIRVRYPAERLLHVDGTPRERLRPAIEIDLAAPNGGPGDPILYQGLKLLEKP